MLQNQTTKAVRGIDSIRKAAYTAYNDWMDRTGIADQSIQRIKNVYSQTPVLPILFITTAVWLLGSNGIPSEYPLVMLPGLMKREKVVGLSWAVIGRVSTGVQHNSNSTDRQIEDVNRECQRADGEVVCELDLAESGTSIERESLDEVAKKGEEGLVDILGVSKFDRLMRADPWKSLEYLRRLKEANVILYVDTHGYFDYDDLYDFQSLVRQVVFAREWFERLKENAEDGQIEKLEDGRWPFGNPPYGYEKKEGENDDDDGDKLFLKPGYDEVLSAMFRSYQEKECLSDVCDVIEQQYDVKEPSDWQVGNILENKLCLGELTLTGEVVARKAELAVVDKDTFREVQTIRYDQRSKPGDAQAVPEAVNRAAREFGAEYVTNLVDSIEIRCRKCGSEMRKNGTEERYGTTVQKYRCKDDDCRYQSPLLTKEEFDKFHGTLPTRCPWCPSTGTFDITPLSNSNWDFKYNCKVCDSTFAADKVEGKYERAANNPDLEFSWFKNNPRESLKQSGTQDNVDTSDGQKELSNFSS
jgi:DNA invertase Pin-like site-specific DNA recombinase/transposase-like protein